MGAPNTREAGGQPDPMIIFRMPRCWLLLLLACAAHAYPQHQQGEGSSFVSVRRYASGGASQAPAKAKVVSAKVKLTGISVAQFDKTAKDNFKAVVGKGASERCGADGNQKCTAADVTITSVTAVRRSGINVEFFVKTTAKSKPAEELNKF